MGKYSELYFSAGLAATYYTNYGCGAVNYIVKDNGNNLHFCFDADLYAGATHGGYLKYNESTKCFSEIADIFPSNLTSAVAVWYDRWSGIDGDLIHVAQIDPSNSDVNYFKINASTGVISTRVRPFNGVSVADGGSLSITRARGGNVCIAYCIDGGVEYGFAVSTDAGGSWSAKSNSVWEGATQDQVILAPGWAADNQDIMAFFWDASADEISMKLYDNSANSWSETSIATSMVDTVAATSFPHFAATVDIANSRNLLVAWSAVDTANADLRCWTITEGTQTEVTNVVLNSADDQGLCAIGIDTDTQNWYVFYAGKSDGSETMGTSVNLYCKVSKDSGTTWGAESLITSAPAKFLSLHCTPRFKPPFALHAYTIINQKVIMSLQAAHTTYQLGL